VLTIADNDVPGPPGMLRFSAAAFAAVENAGPATITVERVNGSAGPVSVQYATSNGSATQPGDYALASGTLNWADGDTAAKTFNVTLVNDGIEEPDETINLTLSIPGGGAMLGPPGSAVLTISDPPQLPFRGTNLVGMEQYYAAYDQVTGPVAGNNYPVFDTRNVDYFAGKGITTLRFLFSWEAMQSQLFGTIPAANAGNYKDYFDNYKRIVDYATNVKGMQVIVEPWQANPDGGAGGPRWRGDLVGSVAVPTTAWSDFWTKMAGIFAANPRVAFGLVNEPNNMSTMGWWAIAQAGVTAIRSSGATQRIYIPGNGYSAASTWTSGNYFNDPDAVKRSNAYGWLHANGGTPIFDPLNNIAAEVHTYLDDAQGGLDDGITSVTAAREHLTPAIDEGRLRGYKIYLGELGMYASNPIAPAAWADFISYFEANADEFAGFTWWAGGDPVFWPDVHAAYFSISPTSNATYTGDTVNMDMIEDDF
jgi:endoglucanase